MMAWERKWTAWKEKRRINHKNNPNEYAVDTTTDDLLLLETEVTFTGGHPTNLWIQRATFFRELGMVIGGEGNIFFFF